jgi:hypothetical protein
LGLPGFHSPPGGISCESTAGEKTVEPASGLLPVLAETILDEAFLQGRPLFPDPGLGCDPGKILRGKTLFPTNRIHHTFCQAAGHPPLLKLTLEEEWTSRGEPQPIPNQRSCELLIVQQASFLQPLEAMGDLSRIQ